MVNIINYVTHPNHDKLFYGNMAMGTIKFNHIE